MEYEKKILTALVENYRRSRKDSGDNKISRRTQVRPEKFYKRYNANDGDFDEISKLNEAAFYLSGKGFVVNETETFGTQLKTICLKDEKIAEIEEYLADKFGYVPKDRKLKRLQELRDKYRDASGICKKECAILSSCITERKIPKDLDELDQILKAVAFIENNQEELYIREASMKIYGDSKFFEEETLQPVCKLLRKYSDRVQEDGELPDEILLCHHIAKEPQRLCIKGNAVIHISGKEVDISGFPEGVEFLASDLEHIQAVTLLAEKFMTIENRTSYLRYRSDHEALFYLGGYAGRYQRDFLKLVYACNPGTEYRHFGDIDAGGFWIHHHLCEVTGIPFKLAYMSADILQKKEYASCLHLLSENDRSRLKELKNMAPYAETVRYMLAQNVKLEQEIVSLTLMKERG